MADISERYTKGETLVALAKLVVENRKDFHADEIKVELKKAEILSDIEKITALLGTTVSDTACVLIAYELYRLSRAMAKDNAMLYDVLDMIIAE